jgi:hypothetical protein
MAVFRMQERDLDLMILEELHSDRGFSNWLIEQLGLKGFAFTHAMHSVVAKSGVSWGETDVLAFFARASERLAVLIEDKISAGFTDRQAQRYHERARALVDEGAVDRYLTLLIAPQTYLAGIPPDDPWDRKLPIEALRDWFAGHNDAHARWRERALRDCLSILYRASAPGREDVVRFSEELSAYLARHHSPTLSHRPGSDPSGPIIRYPGGNQNKTLWWKVGKNQMVMQLMGPLAGRLTRMTMPEGIGYELASDFGRKCDYLVIGVPPLDFSVKLEAQRDVVEAALAAAYRLIAFLSEIEAPANPVRDGK